MTDDNLTRAEARDRATKVSGISYEVSLDLTSGDETFTSETVVRFSAPLVGLATFIDLDARAVREIVFNGRSFPTTTWDAERARIALRGLLATNELRVVADCEYQHTGVGLHRVVDPVDGNVYLHTQFEPFDAHRVFACFDQPDLKATFALTVTAPDGWTVIGNSPVASREGGVWRFAPTPVISTYLAAVVAGPYHEHRDRHGDIDLGLFCRDSLAPHLDPDELLELTRQGLDFFTAEFDYPYPFAKYDQLFVPEFNFGAMENPGCVTFNERMVFRSRVTESAREDRANTLLHEMAHMWFGDLVTMRWWDDLWLNESFATYMASHASASATRFGRAWVRFAASTKAAAVVQDQLPSTHPISADIVDTDAVRLHFDGITYAKGASVLKQLAAWVGADAFRKGLREYFPRHEWENAELSDFLGVLEDASGRDLGAWSKEWLETAGVNTLRPWFELDDAGRYRSLSIAQEATDAHPTLRSHRVGVGLYVLTDEGLVRDRRLELDVVGPATEVPELAAQPQPDLLLLNDDDLTYAKVRLDERSLSTLHAHLSGLVDPLARSLCWGATWDMVRDAELATRRFVDLVLEHAAGEEDDTVLGRLLGQAAAGLDVYGDPANRAAGRARLAVAARRQLEAAEPGSDRQLIWARHWLSTADDPSELAHARALLDGEVELPGLEVDTDLRWDIVGTLAFHGADDGGALIEAELERDPTDIGQRRAAARRAWRQTAEAKADAWERLHSRELSLAFVRAVVSGFAGFGQEELVRPYVEPYFAELGRVWEERPREEALSLIGGLYPGTLVERATVAATDQALGDESLPGPVRRILVEGKDGVERALRARAADRP
ncbi:MAG TPA: aminopeptidase N [Acidimicrobiales bacterium]|nr:aminopeptidase N [Acidimicrobiales bacterium]